MSWGEFLGYLASAGVSAGVGFVLSWVVELWPAYANLEAKYKRLVFFGMCLAVPIAASVAAVATGAWGAWGDWPGTWWPALQSGFLAYIAGQAAHLRKL